MLTLDGSLGEGGGQILRTSLALSLVTGTPFRLERIRAKRSKPGLLRQHLTAVQAAAIVGAADVDGAVLTSEAITFRPSTIAPGDYRFAVGTAGSTMLVLQTVLPALAIASGPSRLVLEGGTHNPFAPPFDFLARAFLPLLARMGPRVDVTLERPGFYPAGGGRVVVSIEPARTLAPITLDDRGETCVRRATALVASLDRRIGERELQVVRTKLGWDESTCEVQALNGSAGPGNALLVEIGSTHVTELFTGFGEHGVRAEQVAGAVVDEARRYLAADVPVGTHLADQLLIPMAMAGSGSFRTQALTRHSTTNAEVVQRFLDVPIAVKQEDRDRTHVRIG
jgi:RNA 3'-terminal phosphate cyclase (ATP)